MYSYKELLRENNYLKGCLNFDEYVYAVCIGISEKNVKVLGCIKFINGVDHYRNRDKMFANSPYKKCWVLVEKEVYKSFKGRESFLIR
jgi:hypothetical protein